MPDYVCVLCGATLTANSQMDLRHPNGWPWAEGDGHLPVPITRASWNTIQE